jgi:hypothetical protein
MNPYTFMEIYKKGFKMTVKETVLRGEAVYEVYLKARYAKMDVKEIYVDIRKSDYQPLCIRVRESNDWQRVSITNFKSNLKFENEFFTFQDLIPIFRIWGLVALAIEIFRKSIILDRC